MVAVMLVSMNAPPVLADGIGRLHPTWSDLTTDATQAQDLPVRHPEEELEADAHVDRDRFLRDRRTGMVGVTVVSVGLTTGVVGLGFGFWCLAGAFGGSTSPETTCPVSGALLVVGTLTTVTGEVLLHYGAIRANRDLREPTTLGWVAAGLGVVSLPLMVFPVVGIPLHVASVVLAAVHLGHAGRVGRDHRLVVVPTSRGFALAGTF